MSTKYRSDNEVVDLTARLAAQQGAITMAAATCLFAPVLALPALAVGAAVVMRTLRD